MKSPAFTFWILLGTFAFLALHGCRKAGAPAGCEPTGLVVPDTYTFTNPDGHSTVNFNSQAQRLEMLEEMAAYLKTGNTPGTVLDAGILTAMYENDGHNWLDAENLGMNGSTKQLKNKTAASSGTADPTIQAHFEDLMAAAEALSATTTSGITDGGAGQGGVVLSNTSPNVQYLQDAEGREYVQLIEKGLMGAVFYNQICTVYLGESKMNVDNTTAVDPENGEHFTAMEHHWDKAYGYFTTALDYPSSGTDRFWGKYAAGREELLGSASALSAAFRAGRTAIVAHDLDARDAQIAIIRSELERVAGATAIHYLNNAVSHFTDDALRNHALSEAWAFLEAIPYGHEPALNPAELASLLDILGTDFYNVTISNLTSVRDQVAVLLNLDDVKAFL